MGKKLSLLKPQLKHGYLGGTIVEKVTYLDVPDHIGLKELKADVGNGAVHMKELEQLVTKKKEPRYIVIDAASKEQAHMAVSYLASCFARKHNRISREEELGDVEACTEERPQYVAPDENGEPVPTDEWQESAYRIPVLSSTEVVHLLDPNDSFMAFPDNRFLTGMNGNNCIHRPYWYQCKTEAVCIELSDTNFGMPTCSADQILEALEFFKDNDKVYILNIQRRRYYDSLFDEDCNDEERLVVESPQKNQIVLGFAADEVCVVLEKEAEKVYYTNIFRSWLTQRKIKVKRSFRYDSVLNIIMAMADTEVCGMIEKILNYALKDQETTQDLVLTNADFAFVDRFVRSYGGRRKENERSARERMEQELIGMDEIKQQVRDVVNIMKFNKMREDMGIRGSQYHNVHLMLGAPGTAKTTVAKLMGQIMVEEKLLKDNRFTCVNGAELKGMFVGHSAPKTKSLFENNDIIVIDEAYSMVDTRGEADSFGNEAIAQLVIELENHAADKLVIFAGYGGSDVIERNNRMKLFLDANPGIKSRINSTFYFASYKADEMVQIFKKIACNEHYQIEEGAEEELRSYFEGRRADSNFGNGREARSLLEASILETAKRVLERKGTEKLTANDMKLIRAADIQKAIAKAVKANGAQCGMQGKQIGFRRAS